MKTILFSLAFAAALPASALAEPGNSPLSGASLSAGESILGHTLELGLRLNEKTGIRGLYGTADYSYSGQFNDNDVDADLHLSGAGVMVDYYPFANSVRVSAGSATLGHSFDATSTGTSTVNGNTYSATVDTHAEFKNKIAPILSAGFSKPLFGTGLHFDADFGAAYTGGVDVTMTDRSGTISQSDMDAQTEKARSELAKLRFAPFVKVGVSLSF